MPWPALAARRRPVRARPVPDLGDPDNPSLEIEEGKKHLASSPLFFRAEATSRPWLEAFDFLLSLPIQLATDDYVSIPP